MLFGKREYLWFGVKTLYILFLIYWDFQEPAIYWGHWRKALHSTGQRSNHSRMTIVPIVYQKQNQTQKVMPLREKEFDVITWCPTGKAEFPTIKSGASLSIDSENPIWFKVLLSFSLMGFKKWRCFLWAHSNISLDSARQQCNIPRIETLSFKSQ